MTKGRFTIESDKINSSYSIHIRKDGEVIFEISNWDSLSEMHKTECEEIVDLLNEQDQTIKKLKEENRLLDIEDERWVKASEQDEETINKLNKEIEKLTHELYLEKGSAEYYKQLAEEYFEEISKLTYKLNKIKDDIER